MARPVKISDRNKAWYVRSENRLERKTETRRTLERFLIVCEGTKTEPNYFKSFQNFLPRNLVQIAIHGEGASTLSLVERAREIIAAKEKCTIKFDHIWLVFDRDSFGADDFDNAINSAKASKMNSAWSNEAFELWYILHFEYRNTAMNRNEYKKILSAHLKKEYEKNAIDMCDLLNKYGNQTLAIKWAKKLHEEHLENKVSPSRSNPCTCVYELINELNSFANIK
jgi:hypothetical protein